jgi:hypothetical protein
VSINNRYVTVIYSIAVIVLTTACSSKTKLKYISQGKIDHQISLDDQVLLDSIQHQTFLYFLNEYHPEMGIIKDRSTADSPASIAATGWSIPTYAVAVERKWMSREEATDRTLKTLQFFYNSRNNPDRAYKGFYYHFLDMKEGKREWQCELSSIDTGLLMMGVIFARNYYDQDTPKEIEIRDLANKLLQNLDWSSFDMDEKSNHPHTISMAWHPEKGTTNWGWHGYTEGLFLYILAAGTGIENPEQRYQGWLHTYEWKTPYEGLSHVVFPPLFGHQFSHVFIDFRGLSDPYLKAKGIDYFENSRRATLTQSAYCKENPKGWKGYDALTWGITATDGPGSAYNTDVYKFEGYAGRGTSGKDFTVGEDGTLAPYGVLSSLPFTPELSLATIKNINQKMGSKIWGKYGYFDAFNETADWVASDFIGLDQGVMILMIENFRTGMVWNYVMKDTIIQNGLEKLNFEYLEDSQSK